MKTALKAAMTTSISNVFETMFFMVLEFDDQMTPDTCQATWKDEILVCRIAFKGKFSGHFYLFIPEALLYILTENFMAMDKEDITAEHLIGTLKEAVNMLAGSTLSNFDDTLVFQLSIPEIMDIDDIRVVKTKSGEEKISIVTETPEGCLALSVVFNT